MTRSFEDLVADAVTAPFTGRDFSWLRGRSSTVERCEAALLALHGRMQSGPLLVEQRRLLLVAYGHGMAS